MEATFPVTKIPYNHALCQSDLINDSIRQQSTQNKMLFWA